MTQAQLRMVILDDYQNVAIGAADWARISDRVEVTCLHKHIANNRDLVAMLQPYDIIFVMRERTQLTAEVIGALKNLKLIITSAPLNAAVDVTAASQRNILVCGTDYTNHATVELVWALIFATMRGLANEIASVRGGGWQVGLGRELFNKTIGIVGLGGIGSRVAQISQAFGLHVKAWSQNLSLEHARRMNVEAVTQQELFSTADIVTVHLRLSERTRGLVGASQLSLMKPTAILINTSRGPIVDEPALVAALQTRAIAGAGIDVYDLEPLPSDHPYRVLSNLVATPHIGYVSHELYALFFSQALENVEAWLIGTPIRIVPDFSEVARSGLPDWVNNAQC